MRLVIPTYQRLDRQLTWNALSSLVRQHITFVARPEEARELAVCYAPSSIIENPSWVRDYPTTMQFILEQFGHEQFIYMDDDIRALHHRPRFVCPECSECQAHSTRAVELDGLGQVEMFEQLLSELKPGVAVAGIGQNSSAFHIYGDRLSQVEHNFQLVAIDGPQVIKNGIKWGISPRVSDLEFILSVLDYGLGSVKRVDYFMTPSPLFIRGGSNGTRTEQDLREQMRVEYARLAEMFPGALRPKKTERFGYGKSSYTLQLKRWMKARRKRRSRRSRSGRSQFQHADLQPPRAHLDPPGRLSLRRS